MVARFPATLSLLLFRSVPFVVYASFSRRLSWTRRLAVAVGALAVGGLAFLGDRPATLVMLSWTPIAAACLTLAACATYVVPLRVPLGPIKCGAVLVATTALVFLLPAATVHDPAVAIFLILGWEFSLKAHSYCVDVGASKEKPRLADCLFFLLVNPTVIFVERSTPALTLPTVGRGALRVARGTLTIVGRDAAIIVAAWLPFAWSGQPDGTWNARYAQFCVTELILLLGLYCAHSGLASVEIGWMWILGYTVPERYRYPFVARSPQDFWNRWNTWLSRWANRYLYVPIAHRMVRNMSGRTGPVVGVLGAFLGVGVLHNLGLYAFQLEGERIRTPSLRFTGVFLLFGLAVVAWAEVSRRMAPLVERAPPALRGLLGVASRLTFANLALLFAFVVIPLLRGGRFPPELETILRRWIHVG